MDPVALFSMTISQYWLLRCRCSRPERFYLICMHVLTPAQFCSSFLPFASFPVSLLSLRLFSLLSDLAPFSFSTCLHLTFSATPFSSSLRSVCLASVFLSCFLLFRILSSCFILLMRLSLFSFYLFLIFIIYPY